MKILSTLLLFCLLMGCGTGGDSTVEPRVSEPADVTATDRLRFVRDGYAANRKSFKQFVCNFTVTKGRAQSETDAIAGKISNPLTKSGYWAVRENQMRYEMLCPSDNIEVSDLAPVRGGSGFAAVVTCSHELLMTDGQQRLRLLPILKSVNLARNASADISRTPFGLGIMGRDEARSPANEIDRGLRGEGFCQYQGRESIDGASVVVIATGALAESPPKKTQQSFTWWLDPKRGFLPLRVRHNRSDGDVWYETQVTSIRRIQDGGFIAERSVSVFYDDANRTPPFYVEIIELTDLELREPTVDELSLTIPAGYTVVNTEDMRSYFTMQETAAVMPSEIGELISLSDEFLDRRLKGEDINSRAATEP